MTKICNKSLLKPLILLFQNPAKLSYFPDIWKRPNIIPVHKKNDKQLVKNYRLISLLPILGKIFEKIVFNKENYFLLLTQKFLFSRKKETQIDPSISFNNIQVERASHYKHLGVSLDEKLDFKQRIDTTILKINKGISVIKKLRYRLPRIYLMTIYKTFLRPLIDCGDIICDQPENESFCEKLESVQYKAALAITGAIQSTSREKIYQGLGLESLKSRRWYKRLSCMFKILKEEAPNYLTNLAPKCETNYRTRNNSIRTFNCRTNCFKYSIFPSNLNDLFNLDLNIRNAESISLFKSKLLSFIRPVQTNIYNIFDPKSLTFLTRLRLGLSHLNEHRFGHNFQDCLNPLCSCCFVIEDTSHYLLHCHHFSHHCVAVMNRVKSICDNFDSKEIYFYRVTHDLMKTKIKLFSRQLYII